jgi:single-stranded DNA-binding protein
MQSIRMSLRAEAQQALQEGDIEHLRQARRCYIQLQNLSSDRQDTDAEKGLEQVRQKLRDQRNALVEEAYTMLNLRQKLGTIRPIWPKEIHNLLDRVEAAQAATDIDTDNHQELNKVYGELKEAAVLCDDVSKQLNALRARWAQARRQGDGRIDNILLSLDSIEGLFHDYPYQHGELHPANADNLRDQMKRDQTARINIKKAMADIEQALDENDLSQVSARFDELRTAEETTSKVNQKLEGDNTTYHSSFAQRYPQQSRMLQLLSERISDHLRREETAAEPEELRTLIARREALQNLHKKLDPDDRAGLYEQLISVDMTTQRLDELEQALKKGSGLIVEAQQQQHQAVQEEANARLQVAANLLRDEVLVKARQARKSLQPVLNMKDSSYQVVKSFYAQAQSLETQAEMMVEQLEQATPWERLQENIREGGRLLDEARSKLHLEEYDEALRLTDEARAKNPALEGDEDWLHTWRAASEGNDVGPSEHSHWMAVAMVVVVLLLLVVFLGPLIWGWIHAFLFPVGAG